MTELSENLPVGHVLLPAATIATMSILLVVGLGALGILDRVDHAITWVLMRGKPVEFAQSLPAWTLWLVTVVFALGLSFALLSVGGTFRRVILWLTTLFLVAGWAPVLSLAAHQPEIGAPLIAVLWSGVCAMVYAGSHRMRSDAEGLT